MIIAARNINVLLILEHAFWFCNNSLVAFLYFVHCFCSSFYLLCKTKQTIFLLLSFVRNAVRNISRIFDERLFINLDCVIVVVVVHYNELDSIWVSIPSNSHRDQKAINLCCFYKYRNKFSLCLKFVIYISTICFRFLIITIYCCLVGKQVNFSNIIVTIYN